MNCTRLARREDSFLADADLNKANISGVLRREPSIDFRSARDAGLRRMGDPEVLALAAAQQRVLVSHDVSTMPLHFREFRNDGKRSPGVFLIPQNLDIGTAIDETLVHLDGFGSSGMGEPAAMVAAMTRRSSTIPRHNSC
jgi:Domain of unknown function (DUF5615)